MRWFNILWTLCAGMLAGCMTAHQPVGDLHRMEPYAPSGETIMVAEASSVARVDEPVEKPAPPHLQDEPLDGIPAAELSVQNSRVVDSATNVPGQRILSRGDRIMISLRGIPSGEEIKNVIDGLGEVTLPYIGQVRVAGIPASDAERLIETTYVARGIYRSINVIVVAEDKVYFVQGEVARQGKFTMSGDVSLLQAITEAGGYTPFANRRNVKVIRDEQVLFFNANEIANGRETDPMIASDDIIVVQRRVF